MYFLKYDIDQFEHLMILLVFVGIIMILSGQEEIIIMFQKYIDDYLGLSILEKSNNHHDINVSNQKSLLLLNHNEIKRLIQVVKEWIIQDYKSSQCRKWIKWINNKRLIIFSS